MQCQKHQLEIIKALCFVTDPMSLDNKDKLRLMDQHSSTHVLMLKTWTQRAGIHVKSYIPDLKSKETVLMMFLLDIRYICKTSKKIANFKDNKLNISSKVKRKERRPLWTKHRNRDRRFIIWNKIKKTYSNLAKLKNSLVILWMLIIMRPSQQS